MLAPVQPLPLVHLPGSVDIRPVPMGHVAGTLPQELVPIGEAVHTKAVAFAGLVVPCGRRRVGGLRLCGPQTDLVQSSSLWPRGAAAVFSRQRGAGQRFCGSACGTLAKMKAHTRAEQLAVQGQGTISTTKQRLTVQAQQCSPT